MKVAPPKPKRPIKKSDIIRQEFVRKQGEMAYEIYKSSLQGGVQMSISDSFSAAADFLNFGQDKNIDDADRLLDVLVRNPKLIASLFTREKLFKHLNIIDVCQLGAAIEEYVKSKALENNLP